MKQYLKSKLEYSIKLKDYLTKKPIAFFMIAFLVFVSSLSAQNSSPANNNCYISANGSDAAVDICAGTGVIFDISFCGSNNPSQVVYVITNVNTTDEQTVASVSNVQTTIPFNTPGQFSVNFSYTFGGIVATSMNEIEVNVAANANASNIAFNPTGTFCTNSNVCFSAESNVFLGTNYNGTINFGDGNVINYSTNGPGQWNNPFLTNLPQCVGHEYEESGVYDVVLTCTTACGTFQRNTTITIVNNLPVSIAQISVCLGSTSNVTLVASPSGLTPESYVWRNAANQIVASNPNGNSITIAGPFISSQSYSCTVTNANGCSGMANGNINVLPIQNISVSGSTDLCGPNPFSYQVLNPVAGTVYNWQVTGGNANSTSGTSNTITWNNIANGGQIIVSSPNICYTPQTLNLAPCCAPNSQSKLVLTGNASSFFTNGTTINPTYLSNNNYSGILVNNTFNVDINLDFDNVTIDVGINGKINIAPNKTLTIKDNSVVKAACNAMWDGIYPASNSTIIINDGTTIQDAVWGVRVTSKNNVTLNIGESGNDVLFNKNRVSIYLLRVSNSSISIKNTEFNSKITDYASTAFLLNPHLDQNPYAGIFLDGNFQDITIGDDSQNNQNRFENLDFGVFSRKTSFTLLNNYFNNLSSNSDQNCYCNAGPNTAVYASGGTLESDAFFVNIGNQGLGQNIFENVNNGVYLYNNFESMIDNNVFNTISKNGITINGVLNRQNISIINNELNNIRNIYISLVDNPKANKIIENNSINLNNPPSNYLFGSGINISETAKSPAKNSIFRNNISAVQTGIYTNGVNESTIVDNDIFLNTNTSNNPGNGILCNKGDKLSIYDNNIEAAHRDNYWVNGIRIEFCTNSIVNCNSMQRTGGGVFVGGSCKGTIIYKNNLRRNYWGYVANYSVSGPPASNYYSDNIWTGPYNNNTWSGGTYWHTLNVGSDPYANRLYVRPNDGIAYKPDPFYANYIGNGQSQNLEPHPFIESFGPIYYPTDEMQFHDRCGNTIAEDPGNGDEGMAMQIIAGQIESPEYNNTMQWWLKYQLYNQLKEEEISAYFQSFVDSTANAGIGKLSEIQEKLNDSLNYQTTELEMLLVQNQGILASGITEEELKFINAQAIEMALMEKSEDFAGYNLQNLNAQAMENLAWECPLAKGPAVFTARVLMNKLNTDFIRYCNACETLAPNTGNNQRVGVIQPKPYQYDESEAYDLDILAEEKPTNTKQFLGVNLYPNPSNGTVNIEFKDAAPISSIEIYNSLGALVWVENVNGNNNLVQINANELANGFYLAKIISNKSFATKSFTLKK